MKTLRQSPHASELCAVAIQLIEERDDELRRYDEAFATLKQTIQDKCVYCEGVRVVRRVHSRDCPSDR